MAEAAADAAAPPPKPGEIRIDRAALGSDDIAETGAALTALFDTEPPAHAAAEDIQSEEETPPAEAEEAETSPIGDDEDGHSEQPKTAAIEPPVSWTADAKQQFAKLPPELQTFVATRESEREKFIASQSQKAAEDAKRFDAERATIANERAQQAKVFQSVILQLQPELQRFASLDWKKLSIEEPSKWAQESQAYAETQARQQAAFHQLGLLDQQAQAEGQKRHQDFLAAERPKLIEKIPEFADPLKGKAFAEDLMKHVSEITPDEWKGIGDHRYLVIARDAMLWRKSQAAKQAAATKRVAPAAQSNVRPLRPAGRQMGDETAKARQLGALHETLRRTGSDRAAADLMAAAGLFDTKR